jgi:AdoMet-dependent rRNA methyltransferase SPB1
MLNKVPFLYIAMYQEMKFEEFLNVENPYVVFATHNAIAFTEEEFKYYGGLVKMPEAFDENIKDLKVLGKREVMQVIKYRNRCSIALKK